MEKKYTVINQFLVEVFNNILKIEQKSLREGKFSDLSITEIHTLECIGMYSERTMSDVAQDLDITVGTLTTAINNLVKKGYVDRQRSEVDRRVVEISLTKKGKLAYRVHEQFHTEMIKATVGSLGEEESEVLEKALQNLNQFFKDKYGV